MSDQAYEEASTSDKTHFMRCRVCGEWIDRRSLDEVFSHETDHQAKPDIHYSGSQKVE